MDILTCCKSIIKIRLIKSWKSWIWDQYLPKIGIGSLVISNKLKEHKQLKQSIYNWRIPPTPADSDSHPCINPPHLDSHMSSISNLEQTNMGNKMTQSGTTCWVDVIQNSFCFNRQTFQGYVVFICSNIFNFWDLVVCPTNQRMIV